MKERAEAGTTLSGGHTCKQAATAPITNVVFDMGGVLMEFEPLAFARVFTSSEEDARLVADALFGSVEWAYLDAGVISEEATEQAVRLHVPERLWPSLHSTLFEWDLHRNPKWETVDLMRQIHEAGYGVYLLTNAGVRITRILENLPACECIDGWVCSALEHLVKPDPRIYTLLCNRYELDPATCAFTDDNPDNVNAARLTGMQAHQFTNAQDLASWLADLGLSLPGNFPERTVEAGLPLT